MSGDQRVYSDEEFALVERAARMLAATADASPLERLFGGPLRQEHETRFPIKLDENSVARLLSAMRITAGLAGRTDAGHSSSLGMSWHDGGDREVLGVGGLIAGIGGSLAAARVYWASSTRKARERISVVMDAIRQTLTRPEAQGPGFKTIRNGAAEPVRDVSAEGGPTLAEVQP